MLVKVSPIFSPSGKARKSADVRDGRWLIGVLSISEVTQKLPGHPKLVARLRNSFHRGKTPYCGDLYDPVIGPLDEKGFTLRGFSVETIDEQAHLRVQVWWIRFPGPFESEADERR